MSTWPNLDCGDMTTRARTYINEGTAAFFTDAEIYRWLSLAGKDAAQKVGCVRRILDAHTVAATRTVATSAYKVHYVEYIPTSGRSMMLTKITPLQTGHFIPNGVTPQFWYEFGNTIGIDPLPAAEYDLRLYVTDIPKMVSLAGAAFVEGAGATQWTDSATGWVCSTTATHSGSGTETLTYNTALAAANTNVTFVFKVDSVGTLGAVLPSCGTNGVIVNTPGIHMQNIAATTPWKPVFQAVNSIVISNFYAYTEADFAATTDQTELSTMWQHLMILYATAQALHKDKREGPASVLENIYNNELAYLRQNVVEIIPDGRKSLAYQ